MTRYGKHRQHGSNFWGEWDDERRRWREEHGEAPGRVGGPPSRETREAWREYFHRFSGDWPEHHWAFGGRRFTPWHKGDVSFNPFTANLFSQGGGLLPLIVLRLLAKQPRYGNEIMGLISEQTSGQWTANPGAIYPLMTELEDRGMVKGEWDDPRKRTVKIYELTELGGKELKRVGAIVRPKLGEAVDVLQRILKDLEDDNDEEGEITL
jgi:DNA-binding PadR family transcriptional regulator